MPCTSACWPLWPRADCPWSEPALPSSLPELRKPAPLTRLRQRLDNLPVGRKLLAALLVLLATVLLVANLAFISAAYWISQESVAPQALLTLGRLIASPEVSRHALAS